MVIDPLALGLLALGPWALLCPEKLNLCLCVYVCVFVCVFVWMWFIPFALSHLALYPLSIGLSALGH
jgi:hypothetical protein